MSDNSQKILAEILKQKREDLAPSLSESEYFEVFCAEQILKDYDLSYDEISAGIVGGAHDGGADGIYIFLNKEVVQDDSELMPTAKRDVEIEVKIIQSKTSGGFSEDPINKLISLSRNLMSLDADSKSFPQYNEGVLAAFELFRSLLRRTASRFPSIKIEYFFASQNSDGTVHPNVNMKASELKDVVQSLLVQADVNVYFVGARQLHEMARRRAKTTFELKVAKNLSATNGYVVLANLSEYNKFIRGGGDKVISEMFDSNVRDFQGDTEVNDEIKKTLSSDLLVDFWWMNNGVTVLSSRATLTGDIVTIENPQIVNGLQTSTQIARHFDGGGQDNGRSVMVKIVSSDDEEARDKIIKATNSQNAVQPATLRATDKIQRDIEDSLKASGLFYDRRKNFYKNLGKPAEKIISIPLMAQAVMSVLLGLPDNARARPSTLIKKDQDYSSVFSEGYPIGMYVNLAKTLIKVDHYLKTVSGWGPRDRTNLRFYVLYGLVCAVVRKVSVTPRDVENLCVDNIDGAAICATAREIYEIFANMGGSDQTAKGSEFRKRVTEVLLERYKVSSGNNGVFA